MPSTDSSQTLRFGDFELDRAAYQLRRRGRPVKLGRQPMELLILLVESRGQLVARSEIVDRLWGKDVFVDVETGVNTAISKVRQALGESPDAPMFLETIPGKGYRFTSDVEASSTSVGPSSVKASLEIASQETDKSTTATTGVRSDSHPLISSSELAPPTEASPIDGIRGFRRPSRTQVALGVSVLLVMIAIGAVAYTQLTGGSRTGGVTLAVLPFENLGNDPDRDYLAAGLTEETSASLAQIDPEHLSLKGRALVSKRMTRTAAEIGHELSVDYLVESSLRAEGPRVRVTVTLIRMRDQAHVWSRSYDREPTSLLGFQQELSLDIAQEIRLRLSPDRQSGAGRRQTRNPEAYDTFLRARHQRQRRTADGNLRAIALYKRAIEIDQGYALAWSNLAMTYATGTINGDAPPTQVGPLARAAALHAVDANSDLSEAQLALGYVSWVIDWDWKAAEVALRRATALDPSSADAHMVLGHVLSQSGRQREADTAMRRARELDPLNPLTRALSAQVAFQGRDVAAALEHARRAIALGPDLWIGYIELAQAYEGHGDHDLALEAINDAERFAGGNSSIISLRGYVLATSGRAAAAREAVSTLEAISHTRYVPPYATATVYAGLGERTAMFEFLERAYAARDVNLIYLPVDVRWDPYRADPRFADLVARCAFTSAR
jgi:DNA-binding winged helix-turn-helix (wHTH) protein/TolB-like protein/Flp pilus assembly protein TadD